MKIFRLSKFAYALLILLLLVGVACNTQPDVSDTDVGEEVSAETTDIEESEEVEEAVEADEEEMEEEVEEEPAEMAEEASDEPMESDAEEMAESFLVERTTEEKMENAMSARATANRR